jgi:hypothetical protein
MKSKSFFASCLLLALCGPAAWSQQPGGVLSVADPGKQVVKRTGETTVTLRARLQPGYHCNSDRPNEDWLIPLRLTWQSTALEAVQVTYPKAKLEKFEFSEKPVAVFDGSFDIATRLRRLPNAMPGPAVLSGKLRYQACNDKMCLPPRTVEVKVPLIIE